MSREQTRQRAATAREHLQVALEYLEFARKQPGPSAPAQVSASNAIAAGIAAADAICGKRTGVRAADQDHKAAAELLATVLPDGAVLSKKFHRLVKDKSLLQYGDFCTSNKAEEMSKQAKDIIESMGDVHGL